MLFFCLNNLLELTFLSFQPTNGGKQITNDNTHKPAINIFALECDIILGYVTGRVTATYRSNDMAHRFKILAVHIHTSMANQILHHKSPKIQTCKNNFFFILSCLHIVYYTIIKVVNLQKQICKI